jgi:CheY-like chemotaxis protein
MPHSKAAPTGARILVVDDERKNRQLIEVMLGADGYRVQCATSGDEALAMVAAEPPDLILLDVMMPGMDGYRVATKIKSDPATEHIPVVMVSALDDRNSRTHALNVGAAEFITKPVNHATLKALLRTLLGAGA